MTDSNSQYFDLNNDYILMLLTGEAEQEDGEFSKFSKWVSYLQTG